jgi:exopolysaccharide production protein ExoY
MSYMSQIYQQGQAVGLQSRRPVGGAIKRGCDIALALAAIIALLPLLAACYLLVAATSPGPVIFRHRRIGFGGRQFDCFKFRTMQIDAERRLRDLLAKDPEARREWELQHKLRDDPRVTPFGLLMRRSSLDELPQLFNILFGQMSMVGPRPIVESEVSKYGEHFPVYASGRPGLSGLWQVRGRNTTSYDQRVAYDVEYLRNWSLGKDLGILIRTVGHVFDGTGAY